MKKKQILKDIYLVEFPTTIEAAMTFMRFQEHYFKTISSDITSTTEVEILQELRGKYLTKVSLCYISSFNPDRLKIVLANHGEIMEGKEGCATVYLNDQNQIEKVTLGITLKLPKHDFDTIDCDGHIMECLLQGWKYR